LKNRAKNLLIHPANSAIFLMRLESFTTCAGAYNEVYGRQKHNEYPHFVWLNNLLFFKKVKDNFSRINDVRIKAQQDALEEYVAFRNNEA